MPDKKFLVINTSPTLALIAALGDLKILDVLYDKVLMPFEVCLELQAGGNTGFGLSAFEEASWIHKKQHPLDAVTPFLANSLDRGEAAVIQLALDEGISRVAIDEVSGRRVARLSGLTVTGSIGILLRAKKEGYPITLRTAIERMHRQGIWLSQSVIDFALRESGE